MAKKEETEAKEQKSSNQESKAAKDSKKAEEASSGFKINEFLKGTKEELDKVVWPTRQQLISESLAVILMVTLSATVIYLVDNFFTWVANSPHLFG